MTSFLFLAALMSLPATAETAAAVQGATASAAIESTVAGPAAKPPQVPQAKQTAGQNNPQRASAKPSMQAAEIQISPTADVGRKAAADKKMATDGNMDTYKEVDAARKTDTDGETYTDKNQNRGKNQNRDNFENSVLVLSGASCIEELTQDELDRYQSLAEHPLDLNLAGKARLLSSGLFSQYQAASLTDYRSRSGDILSFSELGLVDGFSPEFAEALKPFVVLRTDSAPGQRKRQRLDQSVTAGASARHDGQYTARIKYSAELGERAEFRWTSRTTYSEPEFRPGTFSAAYYGKRILGKVVLGHFSARFGQGLALWSGFSMSGYSSAASFRKNASGISTTGSATAELFGVASDWNAGKFTISAAYSFIGKRIIGNLSWTTRRLTLGVTATGSAVSLDWRLPLPDISVFGELCSDYEGRFRGTGGLIWIPEYGRKYALQARWHDAAYKEYSGVAAGVETPSAICTVDAARRNDKMEAQYKGLVQLKPQFAVGQLALMPQIRWSGRLRPSDEFRLRNDLRADIAAEWRGWTLSGRFNALWCQEFGWLWYAQAGRKTESFTLSIRGGIFRIDNWNDRIYVYQQDAPGTFNVPAFYGRGWNLSLYAAVHIGRHHSIWLRAESIQYPWNLSEKPGRLEFRLQYRWRS